MCTRSQCEQAVGQWVSFRTKWGNHRGVVEQVNPRGVLVRVPQQYAPATLLNASDNEKLDLGLVRWAGPYGGYGGGGWGNPGYGAWYGGWWWWWLAFAWIFWLAFLW